MSPCVWISFLLVPSKISSDLCKSLPFTFFDHIVFLTKAFMSLVNVSAIYQTHQAFICENFNLLWLLNCWKGLRWRIMVYCYLIYKRRAWRGCFECDAFNLIYPWVNVMLFCGPTISFLGSSNCYLYSGV